MIPTKSRSAVNRRARQNKRSGRSQRPMLSLMQASEVQLATRKDNFVHRGKSLLTQVLAAGINTVFMGPSFFGSRTAQVATIFTRWRVIKIILRIPPVVNGVIMGILDDSASSILDLPTTASDVLQLRCSTLATAGNTSNTEFEWKPIDEQKWYYTDAETAGGDNRFITPGTFVLWGFGVATILVEVHYTLEFEGATENS